MQEKLIAFCFERYTLMCTRPTVCSSPFDCTHQLASRLVADTLRWNGAAGRTGGDMLAMDRVARVDCLLPFWLNGGDTSGCAVLEKHANKRDRLCCAGVEEASLVPREFSESRSSSQSSSECCASPSFWLLLPLSSLPRLYTHDKYPRRVNRQKG